MNSLNIKLSKNKHYINYGSIFSRMLLLIEYFKRNDSILIIVENDKFLNSYLKNSKYLKIELFELNNISDFINFSYNNFSKYIVTKELFEYNLGDNTQFEYNNVFKIKKGEKIEISKITKKLLDFNYSFSEYENNNSFRILGDVLSITNNINQTLKISFWGDNIDEISLNNIFYEEYYIGKSIFFTEIKDNFKKSNEIIINKIKDRFIIIDSLDFYSDYDEILGKLSEFIVFNSLSNNHKFINLGLTDLHIENIDDFKILLEEKNIEKTIITKNIKTVKNFLNLNNLSNIIIEETSLNNLKSFKTEKHLIICDDNISRIFIKKRVKRKFSKNLDLMMQIKPGDYIVHIDHGVGIFNEIVEKKLGGIRREYITLEYKNNDKLFIPITEVGRVSKYVGSENPKLTGLSTHEWEKKLKKVSEDVEIIAGELLELYAKRKLTKGFSFKDYKEEQTKFFNSFEYVYTDDQISVIEDIYKDMSSVNPMDRLLSGDVGFGKTEVAFASIYKSIINNKQAALISPLVVLAYEHFEKAKERFRDFPINIGVITRFEKVLEVKRTLEKLKNGKIDLIIGTHRLLSEDIEFKDLGLLVIDEEHKFGVKDKEKIKKFKGNIDILSMSATPIPRSLNMALNGIKQVSMLTTPPYGRQDIQTIVSQFDDRVIFDAAKREFERKGQLFFIHNRVETIEAIGNYLEKLLPGKKIAIVHGQLFGDKLEQRIIDFKAKKYDILLATTVVENGIDFSNVNTIFINQAGNFGISQIHQLRGRVGRSDRKGYCYLLFKKDRIKEDAAKRLKTIVDYSHLGAGFELAIKDLEIRGGGDILGIKQSGKNNDIGINLFLEMLENKVEELKNKLNNVETSEISKNTVSIDLNISAYIDDIFFNSELDKINFYREIESLDNIIDLNNIIEDFKLLNNNISSSTNNFFNLLKLKIKAKKYKINHIKKVGINYQIDFDTDIKIEELKEFLKLDKKINFVVVSASKLRSSIKNFENEEKFLEYLLQIFDNKIKSKIRLKLKK